MIGTLLLSLTLLLAPLTGVVVKVSDGDTLQVKMGGKKERVRLIGVDCPEVAHGKNDPGQEPWGGRARAFTQKLVLGKTVRLETDVTPRDKYGRLLAYVFVGPLMLNEELIRNGHAVLLTYPPNVRHVERFTQGQREAREKGRGIWSPTDPLPETPYQYRHPQARPDPAVRN